MLSVRNFPPTTPAFGIYPDPHMQRTARFCVLGYSLRGREQGNVPRGKARPGGQDGDAEGRAGAAEGRARSAERQAQGTAQDHPKRSRQGTVPALDVLHPHTHPFTHPSRAPSRLHCTSFRYPSCTERDSFILQIQRDRNALHNQRTMCAPGPT